MRTTGRLATLVVASAFAALTAACAASPTSPSSAGTSDSSAWNGNINASQTLCVDEVNKYRASVGLAPVSRSTELESFGAQAAEYDGKLGVPHSYFRVTNGGGISKAENELLLWKGYSVDQVIREGIARMWAEGPGGGHYENLVGNYTQVGCGIWLNGNEVNIGQELR
jgi:uncharacterized protein YkwD